MAQPKKKPATAPAAAATATAATNPTPVPSDADPLVIPNSPVSRAVQPKDVNDLTTLDEMIPSTASSTALSATAASRDPAHVAAAVAPLRREIQVLSVTLAMTRKAARRLLDIGQQLEIDKAESDRALAATSHANDLLTAEVVVLRKDVADCKATLGSLRKELELCRDELTRRRKMEADFVALRTKFLTDMGAMEGESAKMRDQLARVKTENARLAPALEAAQKKVAKLEQELTTARQQAITHDQARAKAEASLAQYQQQLQKLQQQQQQYLQQVEKQRQQQQQQAATSTAARAAVNAALPPPPPPPPPPPLTQFQGQAKIMRKPGSHAPLNPLRNMSTEFSETGSLADDNDLMPAPVPAALAGTPVPPAPPMSPTKATAAATAKSPATPKSPASVTKAPAAAAAARPAAPAMTAGPGAAARPASPAKAAAPSTNGTRSAPVARAPAAAAVPAAAAAAAAPTPNGKPAGPGPHFVDDDDDDDDDGYDDGEEYDDGDDVTSLDPASAAPAQSAVAAPPAADGTVTAEPKSYNELARDFLRCLELKDYAGFCSNVMHLAQFSQAQSVNDWNALAMGALWLIGLAAENHPNTAVQGVIDSLPQVRDKHDWVRKVAQLSTHAGQYAVRDFYATLEDIMQSTMVKQVSPLRDILNALRILQRIRFLNNFIAHDNRYKRSNQVSLRMAVFKTDFRDVAQLRQWLERELEPASANPVVPAPTTATAAPIANADGTTAAATTTAAAPAPASSGVLTLTQGGKNFAEARFVKQKLTEKLRGAENTYKKALESLTLARPPATPGEHLRRH
ncbi:hypothetical protein GGF31_006295 [Allomyces arbusculus]|nr:hypothetical protein GGF31_006295 [Allomyces arbusculus]